MKTQDTDGQVGVASHSGNVRPQNEDSYGWFQRPLKAFEQTHAARLLEQNGRLYLVADGMGGHESGEVASAMAVEQIESAYYRTPATDPATALTAAIVAANAAIYAAAQARREQAKRSMGTTVVCAVITGNRLTVAHVGDSRAYRLRAGTLERLTEDHDWVTAQMRSQRIGRSEAQEQARQRGATGVLLRALGAQRSVQPDVTTVEWHQGDTLLLCSDGLHGLVDDPQIARILAAHPPTMAARALIDAANQAGGHDNITAFVISCAPVVAPAQPWTRRAITVGALLIAMLLVLFGATLPVANGQPLISSNRVLEFAGLPTLQPTSGILPTATATATRVPPTATATSVPTATALPPTRIPPTANTAKPPVSAAPNLDRPTSASRPVDATPATPTIAPATVLPTVLEPVPAQPAAPTASQAPAVPLPPSAIPSEPADEAKPVPTKTATSVPALPTALPPTAQPTSPLATVEPATPTSKPLLPTAEPPTSAPTSVPPTSEPATTVPTAAAQPSTAALPPATALPIEPTVAPIEPTAVP